MSLDFRMLEILAPLAPARRDYLLQQIGKQRWQHNRDRDEARNAALVDVAERHFPGLSPRAQSIRIRLAFDAMGYASVSGSIPPRNLDDKQDAIRRVADLCRPGKFPHERHIARLLKAWAVKRNGTNSLIEMCHSSEDLYSHEQTIRASGHNASPLG